MASTASRNESGIHNIFPRVFQLVAAPAIGGDFRGQILRFEMLSEMGAVVKGNGGRTGRGIVRKFGMAVFEVVKLNLMASLAFKIIQRG